MLEIRNLTKIYKTKNSPLVKALKDVNLSFDNNGLVFLLGKSGSGKSTLLNLIGGLDDFDNGEIIIYGNSTVNFNKNDFDNYRNSIIGFIFQEHNLLENISVYNNIAISLELQNRKFNKNDIHNILNDIDLTGYENRMPNELSTGQKQRVAIARALIKNSNIILADEPTGALDHENGVKIMELLKEISKNKLIIVVSHDKEFAYKYGDRIIEIEDGQIISDLNKTYQKDIKESKVRKKTITTSKFPLNYAIQAGLKSFSKYPIRFLLTILISTMSFIMFGVVDTFNSFDEEENSLQSMYDYNSNFIPIVKDIKYGQEINDVYLMVNQKEEDLEFLRNEYPSYSFNPVIDYYNDSLYNNLTIKNNTHIDEIFQSIYGTIEVNNETLTNFDLNLIYGRLPVKNEEDNEILITKITFEQFKKYGYTNGENKTKINNYNDIIGKDIILKNKTFVVVGIVDTLFKNDRYNKIIENSVIDDSNSHLMYELQEFTKYGMHCLIFVREDYYKDNFSKDSLKGKYNLDEKIKLLYSPTNIDEYLEYDHISTFQHLKNNIYWINNQPKSILNNNEILIPLSSIESNIEGIGQYSVIVNNKTDELIETFVDEHFHEIESDFNGTKYNYILYIKNYINNYHVGKDYSYFKEQAVINVLNEIYLPYFQDLQMTKGYEYYKYEKKVKVAGIYDNTSLSDYPRIKSVIVSNDLFEEIIDSSKGHFLYTLTSLKNIKIKDLNLIKISKNFNDNSKYYIYNEITYTLSPIVELINNVSSILIYLAFSFAIFSILLFFNFINTSILYRKKEVGILRSLGFKKRDVLITFLIESIIIALIIFIISSIGTFVVCNLLNSYMKTSFSSIITILTFGLRQIIIILIISIASAVIATYLPINKYVNKKPIESIILK